MRLILHAPPRQGSERLRAGAGRLLLPVSRLNVRSASPQEIERIAMELSLVEKGKVYVKGIFDQKEALATKQ